MNGVLYRLGRSATALVSRISIGLVGCALVGGSLVGCTADTAACEVGEPEGATSHIVRTLAFTVPNEDGTVPGTNLDGRVSDRSDAETCRVKDFVSPNGTEGVDNQFSILWQAVRGLVDDSVDGLLQNTINEGRILLLITLEGVDDVENDPCVTLRLREASGVPVIGTDGAILDGQTFDLKTDGHEAVTTASIVDGVLRTDPFDATIPISVLRVLFNLRAHDMIIEADVAADGTLTGTLSAAIEVAQIAEEGANIGTMDAAAARFADALPLLLERNADLARNPETGKCEHLSASLQFEAKRAFLFEQP